MTRYNYMKSYFQAFNTVHYHILLFLEGDGIDHLNSVDETISPELPGPR